MARKNKRTPADFLPDEAVKDRFLSSIHEGRLGCAEAFALSNKLGLSEAEIGLYADACDVRLEKCQIGLFGYGPGKKRLVKKVDTVAPELAEALNHEVTENVISCKAVFDIAHALGIGKTDVGDACETLGIKIKGCRFGAF